MATAQPRSRSRRTRLAKIARWAAVGCVLLAAAAMAVSVLVSRPLFDEHLDPTALERARIAPREQALTFARYRKGTELRTLLVERYEDGVVRGSVLATAGTGPIALLRQLGYDGVQTLGAQLPPIEVPEASLSLPFDAGSAHVGIGLNYREHAAESGIGGQPFVFPKIGRPAGFRGQLARGQARLLDYEVELCLVALDDIAEGVAHPPLGLVLCNDVTDRWQLVTHMRPGSEKGTTGFADGKSGDGFAVLGPLLVVPREMASFYADIGLELWLNGRLRQRDTAASMVWRPRKIIGEILERSELNYVHQGSPVRLLPTKGVIPSGTVIFSGTPAGVIFRPLNLWNPWVYLRAGDEVALRANFLGSITSAIVE